MSSITVGSEPGRKMDVFGKVIHCVSMTTLTSSRKCKWPSTRKMSKTCNWRGWPGPPATMSTACNGRLAVISESGDSILDTPLANPLHSQISTSSLDLLLTFRKWSSFADLTGCLPDTKCTLIISMNNVEHEYEHAWQNEHDHEYTVSYIRQQKLTAQYN